MSKSLLDYLTKNPAVLPEEVIHVEQWGRDVTLRGLTSRERDMFEEQSMRRASLKAGNGSGKRAAEPDLTNLRARMVARHIVEGGVRTFANDQGEKVLGDQPANVLEPLVAAAQRLSGFSTEDVEDLTKNYEATPEDELSSDSLGSQAEQLPN